MQQLALFEIKQKEIKKGSVSLKILSEENGFIIAFLTIPSGKFIIKYLFENNKISEFEVIDYTGYLYISLSLIKTLKGLVQLLLTK